MKIRQPLIHLIVLAKGYERDVPDHIRNDYFTAIHTLFEEVHTVCRDCAVYIFDCPEWLAQEVEERWPNALLLNGDGIPGLDIEWEAVGVAVERVRCEQSLSQEDRILVVNGMALTLTREDLFSALNADLDRLPVYFSVKAPEDHPCQFFSYERMQEVGSVWMLDAYMDSSDLGLPTEWRSTKAVPSSFGIGKSGLYVAEVGKKSWGALSPLLEWNPKMPLPSSLYFSLPDGTMRYLFDPSPIATVSDDILGVSPFCPLSAPWLLAREDGAELIFPHDVQLMHPLVRFRNLYEDGGTSEGKAEQDGFCSSVSLPVPDSGVSAFFYLVTGGVMNADYSEKCPFPHTGGLWEVGSAREMRNLQTGELITGRQGFPEVLEAIPAMLVCKAGGVEKVRFYIEQGKAGHLNIPPARAVVGDTAFGLFKALTHLAGEHQNGQE